MKTADLVRCCTAANGSSKMNRNELSEHDTASESPLEAAAKRAAALQRMIGELLVFSGDDRRMLLDTLATFFGFSLPMNERATQNAVPAHPLLSSSRPFQFSEESDMPSPKAFIVSKSPKTDVQRVACLAYYLAHYGGIPHFKTKNITALNIESAHTRFSNPTNAVENATKIGYVVPSIKGSKQISATGPAGGSACSRAHGRPAWPCRGSRACHGR